MKKLKNLITKIKNFKWFKRKPKYVPKPPKKYVGSGYQYGIVTYCNTDDQLDYWYEMDKLENKGLKGMIKHIKTFCSNFVSDVKTVWKEAWFWQGITAVLLLIDYITSNA